MGKIVNFHLPAEDVERAATFYREVFGWQPSEPLDMGAMGKYQMFNRPHGMIGGMMNNPPEMAHVPPHWQIYFRVPDINAAIERIDTARGNNMRITADIYTYAASSTGLDATMPGWGPATWPMALRPHVTVGLLLSGTDD